MSESEHVYFDVDEMNAADRPWLRRSRNPQLNGMNIHHTRTLRPPTLSELLAQRVKDKESENNFWICPATGHVFETETRSLSEPIASINHVFIDEGSRITKAQMKQLTARLHRILPKEHNMNVKDCIFRDIVIYGQSFIAGCISVSENEVLSFKHEKNNLHDAFAIKAYNKHGKPVGWVPKEISPAIARLLKDRYVVTGIAHKKPTRMWASRSDANFSCDMFAKKGRK